MSGSAATATADGELLFSDPAELVNGMLGGLLEKFSAQLVAMPRMQQGFVASVVSRAKESLTAKLVALLEEKRTAGSGGGGGGGAVTQQDIMELLAGVGAELEEIKRSAAAELAA